MPTTLSVRTPDGGTAGTVELADSVFGIEPNLAVLHQVVTAQLAAKRSGSQNTKTRAEVRGGGRKPWRQKGTGRARQGSIASPQFKGGGVVHAPKPRSFRQKTNRKMVRIALYSALSDRVRSERVMVVDQWSFDTPKTSQAVASLTSLELAGRVLLVLGSQDSDRNAELSFRNLTNVDFCKTAELNAYDILRSDWLVFTKSTLPSEPASESASAGSASTEPDTTSQAASK